MVNIASPYHLIISHPIVAILTDSLTASSGEAVTIAFKGRNQATSFGMRTAGVPTGIEKFYLSDNSVIYLSTSFFADRKKTIYKSYIFTNSETIHTDALKMAVEWINFVCK